ncbi:hypothetical protein R3P38DRAFT_602831 [Favolaschia claudopus]|uniref:Uncharacterized protein n=1 Tax=Favolaschia claudopus TaxID=2862362 RepID=A0AAW0C791_9AGAR
MGLENDSQDVLTELSSNILLGQSLTTFHVSGGVGGPGGKGGQEGGTGGNAEGPTLNVSGAAGWVVHINDRSAVKNSSTLRSAIDSAPPAISICDVNLQQEVYLDCSRVYSRPRSSLLRRYYSAEVKDRKEMTVVLYEGQDAEEELKRDVAKYMEFRHPSFLQLYGMVYSGNIYANIFYDALIPFKNIVNMFQQSPMLPCYINASVANEFKAVQDHFESIFETRLRFGQYRLFLRPCTGRLCIDLEGYDYPCSPVPGTEKVSAMRSLSSIDTKIIIESLTVKQYHEICNTAHFRHITYIEFPVTTTVHLGAVYYTTGHYSLGSLVAIAPTLDMGTHAGLDPVWQISGSQSWPLPHTRESGWDRFDIYEIQGNTEVFVYLTRDKDPNLWLSQANHIFNCLGVFSDAENYARLNEIWFRVKLHPQSAPRQADWRSLKGFLFLCPAESFHVGPASFKCPECFGYWSLDPSGVDRLSAEEAFELGFPTISISMGGEGQYWTDSVYAGLRQFHQGKGFDPNSQELARHLGVPLYEVCSDYQENANVDEELLSSDTEQLVDEDKPGPGNLDIEVLMPHLESKFKFKDGSLDKLEDPENMEVSSSLKLLTLSQLSLILFLAILGVYYTARCELCIGTVQ